jgi:bacillithiol biosynthesis cysteine-adding enzyme BshC
VADYLAGEPAALSFYTGHPHDVEAYRRKLDEVRRRFDRPARERAAAALRPTSPAAAERLRRFVEEGGAVVTTGQQAGLFTGPLYTVHKILSAVRLAEALEAALGVVVLPVFWAASEDHDFAEVGHAEAVTPEGELRRVAIRPTDPAPVAMSDMRLGPEVERALDDFAAALGLSGGDAEVLRPLRQAYRPGATVAEGFTDAIVSLFSGFGLLVTDAADPALKAASVEILVGEGAGAAEHERLIAERTARLGEAGYPQQVALVEDATNLFFHGPAGRERVHREEGGYVARESRRRFTDAELEAAIRAEPRAFSPNVFLRPVVESAVFPTLAYVGGPAETAYFAQVGPLFGAFGIQAPLVFPRFSATIVAEELDRKMAMLELKPDDLRIPEHEVLEAVARRRVPAEVRERQAALREMVVEGFGGLIDAAHPIDPNLDRALGARRDRMLLELAKAERKVIRHVKKRNPTLAADVRLARNHLRPTGVPQERVLTVFQYLAREPDLLRRLADAMTVDLQAEPVHAVAGG